jgi:hypothetical protein
VSIEILVEEANGVNDGVELGLRRVCLELLVKRLLLVVKEL